MGFDLTAGWRLNLSHYTKSVKGFLLAISLIVLRSGCHPDTPKSYPFSFFSSTGNIPVADSMISATFLPFSNSRTGTSM